MPLGELINRVGGGRILEWLAEGAPQRRRDPLDGSG